jgi:hypothetical protein
MMKQKRHEKFMDSKHGNAIFSCYQTMKMSPSCLRSLLLHAIFAFFDANIKFIMMIRDRNLEMHILERGITDDNCAPHSKKIPFVNISHRDMMNAGRRSMGKLVSVLSDTEKSIRHGKYVRMVFVVWWRD